MPAPPEVHPTAVVSPGARLGPGVVVGPLCVVGDGVSLGEGTRLIASCAVLGPTEMGPRNTVHPFAALGGEPQDRSHRGEPTRLVIGEGNVFREHVTAHRGTHKDRGVTRVGSHGLFMAGCHLAHDCRVGDHVTLANGTLLGGHVAVGDHVVTGGHVAVQPFVRLGPVAFLAGGAMVERDVPPFVVAAGDRARVRALNRVGLARRGVSPERLGPLREAFRLLFRSTTPRARALQQLASSSDPLVRELCAFFAPAP